jgi:flavin reductase (DIM6/NTAB) family NADH-FMN oxidoreductase RutF
MKKNLGVINSLYPMPVTLVGAQVNGKANFVTVAHVGIMNMGAQNYITVGLAKIHHTNEGIKENKTFSVNIPSEDQVVETDYCGLVSGKETDKSEIFETFYGELGTAPMISQCPVNMECKMHQTIDFPAHDVFMGEIVASYSDEEVLTKGSVDLAKVKPMLFDMARKNYWRLGEPFARCWNVGRLFETKITNEDKK